MVAGKLPGQGCAELLAGGLVLGHQHVVQHAVQGVVGFHVLGAAGLAHHLDQAQHVLDAALAKLGE